MSSPPRGDVRGAAVLRLATTGSEVLTALVALAEYAPAVGVAQLAGVLVDRSDARRVLVAANGALGLCTPAYLLHDDWWWLTIVAFVRSSIAQLVAPAIHTLLPAVAPPGRLVEVNGVVAVSGNVARLAGPALAGSSSESAAWRWSPSSMPPPSCSPVGSLS